MSNDHSTLWQTKLSRPSFTRTLVQRPLLLERLNKGLDHRLILVCAPAGFGKTTLISSWIEDLGRDDVGGSARLPAGWLSLEETESDIIVFVQYTIAALRTIFPGACANTFALLQASQRPPLKIIATLMSNEIEQLPSRFILVLDDFHTIQGEAVPNLLNELLFHWSRTLHLVLISRSNPPLPLTRLRTNDQLTEIRSRDLRFNKEETADFIRRVLQTPLSEPLLEKLDEKTEGWIGALRLATLSLRTITNLEDMLTHLDSSQQILVDYLVDEVLGKQFPVIRTFLLKTSILDRFCAPLCEAVIGKLDPAWSIRACIDWLEREELFIVPLDQPKYWFRYHHLFQDLLQYRLSTEITPEEVIDLHLKASVWFEGRGLIDAALKHALLANDLDLAAGLIERGLRDALNRSNWQAMERWLRLLPEEMIQARPWLLLIRAWILQFSWQLKKLSKYLSQVEALINEAGGVKRSTDDLPLIRGHIAVLKGQQAYHNNQLNKVKAYCQETLRLMPESWVFVRGGAIFYLGLSMQTSGEAVVAERMLLDLFESLENKADVFALLLLQALCFNYHNEGLLEKLRQTAVLLLQQATYGERVLYQAWAHFFLGNVYYQWDELDSAEEHFAAIIKDRYLAHQASLQNGLFGLALVHQARGKNAEAIQIQELAQQADIERIGHVEDSTLSMGARLMLLQGNMVSAFRWANAFTAPVPDHPLLWLEEPHLTRARILLAQNTPSDPQEALQILDAFYEIAERTHNRRYQIEILAMRALALAAQGKTRESQAVLKQAVKLSNVGSFLRVFVDLGPDMQKMLGRLFSQAYSVDTIRPILAAFPEDDKNLAGSESPGRRPSLDESTLAEPLTPREKQILAQLQEPISFKEIAYKLSISYPTVKRHSINIYGKLGVNSRWDAVAKAVELDILPR
jgi:LuxR family maltose regulon positive regulatory protein